MTVIQMLCLAMFLQSLAFIAFAYATHIEIKQLRCDYRAALAACQPKKKT